MINKKLFLSTLIAVAFVVGGSVIGNTSVRRVVCAENIANETSLTACEGLEIKAKAAYMMDFSTQTPIYSKDEIKRLPIASMCKIMTLLLAFEAVETGELTLDELVMVSERAASMGGSQVFLEANAKYLVSELLKSIVVCSANDSCVAMAERLAGSETLFVEKMNEKAKTLGMDNTLFANCTGLPKEPQYSCAKDVAIMLKELLTYEKYYEYGQVWMDKFQHPAGRYTEITNTNKLVRYYDGCDGGKTGFTNEAGFCLAATAKRKEMRIISVVIGEENSKNRFEDVRTMFDYAFANYVTTPIFTDSEIMEEKVKILGSKEKFVAVRPERSVYAFSKRAEKTELSFEINHLKARAPLKEGDKVGELIVYKDGVEIEKVALLAANDVKKANIFDRIQDVAEGWTAR